MSAGLLAVLAALVVFTVSLLAAGTRGAEVATVYALAVSIVFGLASVLLGSLALRQPQDGGPVEQLLAEARRLAAAVRVREQTTLVRLVGDTADAQPADLGFSQPELVFWRTDGGERHGTMSHIVDFYRQLHRGRLVILGPAGSGKSVLAIRLVRDLATAILESEGSAGENGANTHLKVPVRVSAPAALDPGADTDGLADVDAAQLANRLDEWLGEQLTSVYGVPQSLAKELVVDGWILPVFDGVDEMDLSGAEPYRAAALCAALNQPTRSGIRAAVLTCRTDRYEQLDRTTTATDLGIGTLQDATTVEVAPLTREAVQKYLRYRFPDPVGTEAGEARWQPVLAQLEADQADKPIAIAMQSPLRLFLAVTAYRARNEDPADLLEYCTLADLDDHLMRGLIPAITKHHPRPNGGHYDAAQVSRWLTTLTRHLHVQEQRGRSGTDLYIENLWLTAGEWLPRSISAAVLTILATVPLYIYWVRDLVSVGLPRDAFIAAGVAGCCLVAGLVTWGSLRRSTDLRRLDLRKLRARAGRRQLVARLLGGLVFGLTVGLAVGLGVGLGGGFAVGPAVGRAVGILGPEGGLTGGIVFGLIGGSALGLALGLALGFESQPDAIDKPRQLVTEGITHTVARLSVGIAVGTAFGTAFGLARGFDVGVAKGLAFALTSGLAAAFSSPWPRYLVACTITASRHDLPMRLAVFLDWTHAAGLTRLSGTAVQFRHRESQAWLMRNGPSLSDV